ncbi:hypothetical protein [Spirosoma sp. KNUC1025]|uniref:hypothetical protein n=1 Tax=Spirosoma sp. KNUC1025 TaxID=2894082 RepID=UPI003866DDB0|nr:hypothetical protein LN737_17525 [Spirosoma sp. KNUC1025]
MVLTYSLSEADYLAQQLFVASNNERVRKYRQRNRIIWPIAFLGLGLAFYSYNSTFLAYYFLGFSLLYFFFYPAYSKWFYKRFYRKNLIEAYKNRFNKQFTVDINPEGLLISDHTGETNVLISEIERIDEIADYIFPKFKSGSTFIIPKSKVDQLDALIQELKEIAAQQNIIYSENLFWEWK